MTAIPSTCMYSIFHARSPEHIRLVTELCEEYVAELGLSLEFQGFHQEMERMPGEYAPPAGHLLLGLVAGESAGCVGLRPLEPKICEMKRLYVRPAYRHCGLGKELVLAILSKARELQYRHIRLDTLERMCAANNLYAELGFRDIPAYCHNPLRGARYMELDLAYWQYESTT